MVPWSSSPVTTPGSSTAAIVVERGSGPRSGCAGSSSGATWPKKVGFFSGRSWGKNGIIYGDRTSIIEGDMHIYIYTCVCVCMFCCFIYLSVYVCVYIYMIWYNQPVCEKWLNVQSPELNGV